MISLLEKENGAVKPSHTDDLNTWNKVRNTKNKKDNKPDELSRDQTKPKPKPPSQHQQQHQQQHHQQHHQQYHQQYQQQKQHHQQYQQQKQHQQQYQHQQQHHQQQYQQQEQHHQQHQQPKPKKRHVAVVGDSMTKHINGRKLSKSSMVTSHSFSGAKVEDLEDYIKPVLRRRPDNIIIHAGTNNITKDSPQEITTKIAHLVDTVKKQEPLVSITISSIIKRNDKPALNRQIISTNKLLEKLCSSRAIDFIDNDNIHLNCLNAGGLHLNPKGIQHLASNLRGYITY